MPCKKPLFNFLALYPTILDDFVQKKKKGIKENKKKNQFLWLKSSSSLAWFTRAWLSPVLKWKISGRNGINYLLVNRRSEFLRIVMSYVWYLLLEVFICAIIYCTFYMGKQAKGMWKRNPESNICTQESKEGSRMRNTIVCTVHLI